MTLSHFFIDRPIFATVLSIVIVVAGAIAYFTLPVAQYPEVVPPTVVVTAYYPGATPEVIADMVATPIEQEVNSVEMLRALGTSVLSSMLGVTFFGLLLTPVFYVVIRWFVERTHEKPEPFSNHVGTLATIALVPCLLLLSGCMLVGTDYKTPSLQASAGFANQAQEDLSTDAVETAWWLSFQDDRLNQLVELAPANNHDLRVATARIREARALLSETTFDRYPTVTAQGSFTRERVSDVQTLPGSDRDIELYDAGFDATWELAFFGRVRRSIEASAADVGAAEANRRDVIVSLLAEVACNNFELRGTQNRLAVARQNAANQQQTLALTIALLEGGRGTELDTSQAEAQLQSTLASIPPLETAIKAAMYQLGVLIGQPPTVLVAERTLLDAQDQLANSETRTATALVAVYKALGGGWEIAPEMAYSKAP